MNNNMCHVDYKELIQHRLTHAHVHFINIYICKHSWNTFDVYFDNNIINILNGY